MGSRVTAALLDDHPIVLDGVRACVERDPDRRVELVHAATTFDRLQAGPAADVLVIDLELADGSAVPRIGALAAEGRRIVVFSHHEDPETILELIDLGVHGYVTKSEASEHLIEAIVRAAADLPYVSPSLGGTMLTDARPGRPSLSRQETTALRLWLIGLKKASVAHRMGISENTVKQYIDRARIKYADMGRPAPTKAALVARAIDDGLITSGEVGRT